MTSEDSQAGPIRRGLDCLYKAPLVVIFGPSPSSPSLSIFKCHFHKKKTKPQTEHENIFFSYLAELGVVAAESNQLFTDGTTSVGLPLALLGVTDHPLHLVTARQTTVGVPALAGVHQALDAPLDTQLPGLLRVAGGRGVTARVSQIEAELLHFVRMSVLLVAANTEIKVFTDGAVVASLH